MREIFTSVALYVFAFPVFAGTLAYGEIKSITNMWHQTDQFGLMVSGTGPCAGQWVTFKPSNSVSPEVYKRTYATALVAFTTGKPVQVYNYENDTCDGAAFIQVNN